jgi:hypothetical protein
MVEPTRACLPRRRPAAFAEVDGGGRSACGQLGGQASLRVITPLLLDRPADPSRQTTTTAPSPSAHMRRRPGRPSGIQPRTQTSRTDPPHPTQKGQMPRIQPLPHIRRQQEPLINSTVEKVEPHNQDPTGSPATPTPRHPIHATACAGGGDASATVTGAR